MFVKLPLVLVAAASLCAAQYGGGMGGTPTPAMPSGTYTPPSGGYSAGKGIAIGLGAAAAGVGVAYLILHNRGKAVGCLEGSRGATSFRDEKDQSTYRVVNESSEALKPGERVELKGKKLSEEGGRPVFRVTAVAKDYGPCGR